MSPRYSSAVLLPFPARFAQGLDIRGDVLGRDAPASLVRKRIQEASKGPASMLLGSNGLEALAGGPDELLVSDVVFDFACQPRAGLGRQLGCPS